MRDQIEERLRTLQAEFKAGQALMAELQTKQSNALNTLVRISGAIQVLEELLEPEQIDPPLESFEFGGAQRVAAQV